jgi:hypothetical protein
MSLIRESGDDDRHLVRYLLGLLPEEETERLDEMSIADAEFAGRLRVVEDDLVDAYVRGSLEGETLERFESFYLSSPRRRESVRFAEGFLRTVDRAAVPADPADERDGIRAPLGQHTAPRGFLQNLWLVPRSVPAWGLSAVAVLLLVALGALFEDVRLQKGLDHARAESAALSRQALELQQQLDDQSAASAAAVKELERVRASVDALEQKSEAPRPPDRTGTATRALTTALVLLPQTRAVGPIATLEIPTGTDRVAFELRLESNDFPRYEVALKDPATSRIVWRSGRSAAKSPAGEPSVPVIVPAAVLKPQHYSLELIGRSAAGAAEVVGSYTVRIVSPPIPTPR